MATADLKCPKCGFEQQEGPECHRCGIIFARVDNEFPGNRGDDFSSLQNKLTEVVGRTEMLQILQKGVGFVEALTAIEMPNEYEVRDRHRHRGAVREETGDSVDQVFASLLGAARDLRLILSDQNHQPLLEITRPAWFLRPSDLTIRGMDGELFGLIKRKGGGKRRYRLFDSALREFASLPFPIFRRYEFPVTDRFGVRGARIARDTRIGLRESPGDSTPLTVEFGISNWTIEQKAIILVAAISIDFDYFESEK